MTLRYTHSPLEYYKIEPSVKDPVFATEGSACFDLHAWIPAGSEIKIYSSWGDVRWQKVPETGSIQLSRSDRALIPVGLIFDIPEGWSVRLHSRSGMALKSGLTLANHEGIIDSDYIEPVYAMMTNTGHRFVEITDGDRICQAEMVMSNKYDLSEVMKKPEQKTSREGGFGSTGETSVKTGKYADEFLRGIDPEYPHYRKTNEY